MNLPKKGGAVAVLVFGVIFLLIRIERDKIQEMRRLMLPDKQENHAENQNRDCSAFIR